MGKPQRRTRTSVKDKQGTKSRRTRRRTKDIDQIQDEIARVSKLAAADGASASDAQHRPIDPEKPGLGQFLCVYCDQYFISDAVMKEHLRSKPHKKRSVSWGFASAFPRMPAYVHVPFHDFFSALSRHPHVSHAAWQSQDCARQAILAA